MDKTHENIPTRAPMREGCGVIWPVQATPSDEIEPTVITVSIPSWINRDSPTGCKTEPITNRERVLRVLLEHLQDSKCNNGSQVARIDPQSERENPTKQSDRHYGVKSANLGDRSESVVQKKKNSRTLSAMMPVRIRPKSPAAFIMEIV